MKVEILGLLVGGGKHNSNKKQKRHFLQRIMRVSFDKIKSNKLILRVYCLNKSQFLIIFFSSHKNMILTSYLLIKVNQLTFIPLYFSLS